MARERRRHDRSDEQGDRNDLHAQIVDLFLDKVRDDPYPSTTHLDMLETMLRDDDVEPYTDALMEKVRGDTFPSNDHLKRLMKFA
jgi:hypothetical protein